MNMKEMSLSQSRVKLWETTNCKKKALAEMTGEVVIPPTDSMLKGSFFESGALGSGVKGQITTDLPRLASGKKSIEQIRIETQIQRFHSLFDPESDEYLGWQITDKQLHLQAGDKEGTLDFVCRRDSVRSVWDLKLNGDLMNPSGWWANPQHMDHIQLATYKYLYRQKYGEDPETYYILFDYSAKLNIKVLKIDISEDSLVNYLHRFSVVKETLLELDDCEPTPSFYECNRCLVRCEDRVFKPIITFEQYEV
jgi:hypothetical protein